jgi:hypothetical protein
MIMTKSEFRQLFLTALNSAAQNAEAKVANPISHSFVIELHAPGVAGRLVGVDEALDRLFLGSDRFYRIIDVAIKKAKKLLPGQSIAFVRASGHPAADFSQTWDPSSLGPFKQIIAEEIEDLRRHAG